MREALQVITTRGKTKSGVYLLLSLPRLPSGVTCKAFDAFYQDLGKAFSRLPDRFSSVLTSCEGECTARYASVRITLTAFVSGLVSTHTVLTQVWELSRGVLCRPGDLPLSRAVRAKLRRAVRRGGGFVLDRGALVILTPAQDQGALAGLRRSALAQSVRENRLPFEGI